MRLSRALATLLAALALPALAQSDYPGRRVITQVASASSDGGLDGMARLLTERMQEA
jgi:tripartite-type tricarboxylate transporter receptor subunit TctC